MKSVLAIGLDPTLVDFTSLPGLDAAKVTAEVHADEARLTSLGYNVDQCFVDLGQTAAAVVRDRLKSKRFDCVMIGAGIRLQPKFFPLFERLVNIVHAGAPGAKICFNTNPADTAEAVQRWI